MLFIFTFSDDLIANPVKLLLCWKGMSYVPGAVVANLNLHLLLCSDLQMCAENMKCYLKCGWIWHGQGCPFQMVLD